LPQVLRNIGIELIDEPDSAAQNYRAPACIEPELLAEGVQT